MNDWYFSHIILIEGTFLSFLLALSIQVSLRAGVFSFAGLASYGIGAYCTAAVTLRLGWPAVAAIFAGVVLAIAVNVCVGLIVRKLSGMYLAMATIGVTLIVQVAAFNGGELTGGATGLFGVLSNVSVADLALVSLLAAVVLAVTESGKLGRRIDAVREDPELAIAMGISVGRYRLGSFVMSAVLGATAGGFEALLRTTISPRSLGFGLLITALTVIIIGGVHSWVGAAIGAVFVTWLPFLLQRLEQYQQLVYGVLVVVAAVYFPKGLVGVLRDGWYKVTVRVRSDQVGVAGAREESRSERAAG